MSTKKRLLLAGSLLGGTILLTGALSSAGAFGGGPRGMGCDGPGMGRMGMGGMGGMGHHRGHGMAFVDANKDGVITRDEATAMRDMRFGRFDLDKNGEVTAEEAINSIIKRFEGEVRRKVRSFDENGDGKVSKAEFDAPALERFTQHDLNGDGKLTSDELPRHMQGRSGMRHGWFGRQGGRGMMPGGDAAPDAPGTEGGPQ